MKDTTDLDLSNLDRHIQDAFDGIKLLYSNGHFNQAKYCAYILIDQLAWLVSGSEQSVNVYFRRWVEKYFSPYYPEITPEEIWASRNGLLHNGSSISRDITKGKVARQLFYLNDMTALEEISNKFDLTSNGFFPINTTRFLQVALYNAVEDFRKSLSSDASFDRIDIKEKLGKILAPLYP